MSRTPAVSRIANPSGWDCDIPSCCELGEGVIEGDADGTACYHEDNTVTYPDILENEITDECETKCAETISGECGNACKFRHFCIKGDIVVSETVTENEVEDEQAFTCASGCDHRATYENTRGPCGCCRLAEDSEVPTD